MSNKDFIIKNGILTKYTGSGGNVVIPDGVTEIGNNAFRWCGNLTSITIPDSVTTIGDYAFQYCSRLTNINIPDGVTEIGYEAFWGCSRLTSITISDSVTTIGDGVFYDCKNLHHIELDGSIELSEAMFSYDGKIQLLPALTEQFDKLHRNMKSDLFMHILKSTPVWENISMETQAAVFMKHHEKNMYSFYDDAIKNAEKFGEAIFAMMIKESSLELCSAAGAFIELYGLAISTDLLKKIYDAIKNTKRTSAVLRKIKANAELMDRLSDDGKNSVLPEEQMVFDASKKSKVVIETKFRELYAISAVPELYNLNKEKLDPVVLKWLLTVHENLKVRTTQILPEAAQVIEHLDHDSFMLALEILATDCIDAITGSSKKVKLLYSICLYADEALMNKMIQMTNRSEFRKMAMYSNTRTAMLLLDKHDELGMYAEHRHMDEDFLRDVYLSDIGLDEQGEKTFDLGSQIITAQLQKDLSFVLMKEDNKIIKSLPKKNADPEKYVQAKAELSQLKKDAKKIVKNRSAVLFEQFLNVKRYKSDDWKKSYLKNPLLRSVAELLVWQQGDNTFSVVGSDLITSDEKTYALNDKPVCLAHPMEMDEGDLQAWQKYFAAHGLKQPFLQIWEPVIDPDTVKNDRYKGCFIPIHKLGKRRQHGIYMNLDVHPYYGVDCSLSFSDCDIEADFDNRNEDLLDDTNTNKMFYEIQKFSFKKYTRQVNHIVAYLDQITVEDRILKDDVTVEMFLPNFTMAQITDFINIASENNCTNVTALLLNYKNEHFKDFDPMEEFTLGDL